MIVIASARGLGKAPQGNERGAVGSKTPPLHIRALVFATEDTTTWFLRPLSPYAIASLGIALLLLLMIIIILIIIILIMVIMITICI